MKTFKQFFNESPVLIDLYNKDFPKLDDDKTNISMVFAVKTLYKHIGDINMNGVSAAQYSYVDKDSIKDAFIYNNRIILFCSFDKIENGIADRIIWQNKNYKGLYRSMLFNFYLPKYNFIESDELLSNNGFIMWISIIKEGLQRGNKCTVYDYKNDTEYNIYNNIDIIKYYDKQEPYDRFRIYR